MCKYLLLSFLLIVTPAMAMGKKASTVPVNNGPASCAPNDGDCWAKTAVSCPTGNQLVSVKVLKDLDPGSDWKEIQTSDGTCIVGGQKLTAGMDTNKWKYLTDSQSWTANDGPWSGGGEITKSWGFEIRSIAA